MLRHVVKFDHAYLPRIRTRCVSNVMWFYGRSKISFFLPGHFSRLRELTLRDLLIRPCLVFHRKRRVAGRVVIDDVPIAAGLVSSLENGLQVQRNGGIVISESDLD